MQKHLEKIRRKKTSLLLQLQPAFVYELALHKPVCTWKEWFVLLSLASLPQLVHLTAKTGLEIKIICILCHRESYPTESVKWLYIKCFTFGVFM